jgi:hypothetical protein
VHWRHQLAWLRYCMLRSIVVKLLVSFFTRSCCSSAVPGIWSSAVNARLDFCNVKLRTFVMFQRN